MTKFGYKQTPESVAKRAASLRGSKRGPWSEKQRENSSKTSFKKGQAAWNKGLKMPEMAIDKEQRSKQLKERWKNDPIYAAKARNAIKIAQTSEFRKAILESHDENCGCAMHNPYPKYTGKIGVTKLEQILIKLLETVYPKVIYNQRFGSRKVDAYIPPPSHIAFEADGTKWHQDKEKEHIRDKELFDKFGLLVIHVTEPELLAWRRILD